MQSIPLCIHQSHHPTANRPNRQDERAALARDDFFTLLRAFRALDPDPLMTNPLMTNPGPAGAGPARSAHPAAAGTVSAARLRHLLTSDACGAPLTEQEAAAMVAFAADQRTGLVDCEACALRLATDGRDL
jgi:hypothetical protein